MDDWVGGWDGWVNRWVHRWMIALVGYVWVRWVDEFLAWVSGLWVDEWKNCWLDGWFLLCDGLMIIILCFNAVLSLDANR